MMAGAALLLNLLFTVFHERMTLQSADVSTETRVLRIEKDIDEIKREMARKDVLEPRFAQLDFDLKEIKKQQAMILEEILSSRKKAAERR